MKANDLRIGNLVKPLGLHYHVEVKKLGFTKVWIEDETKGFDEIEPIPITELILLALDFEQSENENWYELNIPKIGIIVSLNLHGRFGIEYKNEFVCIRECCYYLHQLQNLYFALTGEELTIKP